MARNPTTPNRAALARRHAFDTAKRFWSINRRHIGPILAAGLLINCFVLAVPLFSMSVYDRVIGSDHHDTLWALTIGMALVVVLDAMLRAIRVYFIEHSGAYWDSALDRSLAQAAIALPLDRAASSGALLARYKEMAVARDSLTSTFLLPLLDIPFLLLFALTIWIIGGWIVLVPIAFGVLVVAVTGMFLRLSADHHRRFAAAQARKLSRLVDLIGASELTRGDPALERTVVDGFDRLAAETSVDAARARYWNGLGQQVMPVLMTVTTVALLVAGTMFIQERAMTTGGLIASSLLTSRAMAYLASVVTVLHKFREFAQAVDDMAAYVDMGEGAARAADGPAAHSGEALEYRVAGLGYAYPGAGRAILSDIDLVVEPNTVTVLLGRAGAGKSTLLRLLAGHVAAADGTMTVGGRIIGAEPDRLWLGGRVAWKAQEPAFRAGTVLDALRDWAPDLTEADALDALKACGFGPAIARGEIGLNSELMSGGANLSGGQRQMLGIARTLVADRGVLLLDEPTFGLDSTSVQALVTQLARHKGRRTIVIATHVRELLSLADRIVVLEAGRIVRNDHASNVVGLGAAAVPPPAAVARSGT
ncbi:MAG: ATP-binding cassette domain-containing protein [Alphaproteobacteria bacterium]|nr:ATP-binding cassette domain-containing protein [Alphaproteobacteria bacterium]